MRSSIFAILAIVVVLPAATGCNRDDAGGVTPIAQSGFHKGIGIDPFDDGSGGGGGGNGSGGSGGDGNGSGGSGGGGASGGSGGGGASRGGAPFACVALPPFDESGSSNFGSDGLPNQCMACAAASCEGSGAGVASCFESTCRACKNAKGVTDENVIRACASCAWKKLFDPTGFDADPNCNGSAR